MGPLPDHVKGNRSATAETLSEVGIHTYVDPLPVDRTRKPFSRLGADLPISTWNEYCAPVAKDLKPRYERHRQDREYIQADETRCVIMSRATHRARIILDLIGCTRHRW